MRPMYVLVLDLKTLPDESLLLANRDPGSFPKPIQQRIVSLGCLLARILPDGQYERYEISGVETASSAAQTEQEILTHFWQLIDQHRPRLVTWNGRGLILPVLKQRSLIYGLQAFSWHRTEPRYGYDYRYNPTWHWELMDIVCDTGAVAPLALEEAAVAIGLPGRRDKHGVEMPERLATGQIERINRDCADNVLNTYLIYLRWAYFSSRLSARGHNASVKNLIKHLESELPAQPSIEAFLEAWQQSRQPCAMYVPEPDVEPICQPSESHLRSEDVLP